MSEEIREINGILKDGKTRANLEKGGLLLAQYIFGYS